MKLRIMDGPAMVAAYQAADQMLEKWDPARSMAARLRYFSFSLFGNETFLTLEQGREVVAVACCSTQLTRQTLTVFYVSVDVRYRNQGLATQLIEAMIVFARERGCTALDISSYSDEGRRWLRRILARKTGVVTILEKGKAFAPETASPNHCDPY